MESGEYLPQREAARSGFWLEGKDWIQYEDWADKKYSAIRVVTYLNPPNIDGKPDLSTCEYICDIYKSVL